MREEIIKMLSQVTKEEEKLLSEKSGIDKTLYMDRDDNVVNISKMIKNGKKISLRRHTRFVHFPKHTHDYVEIVYMCKGETTHIINGDKILLKEGEFLLLSQNSTQEILPAGENDIAVNFIILPDFFDVSLQMMGDENTPLKNFIVDCLRGNDSNVSYLHFEVKDVLPIQNIAENVIWNILNDVPNKRKINEFSFGILFLYLINNTDKLHYVSDDNDFAIKVLQYVEANFKDGSLMDLSKMLFYEMNSLSKEIKKVFGKTYVELVRQKRLSYACFLLKETDFTIEEITHRIGYENKSFFYKVFQKEFDMSPKKYRGINTKKEHTVF